ncbi:MAG: hypothetical protein WAR22_00225 [Desulfomonilia bacterium]|jgi:hypothetical protein
MDKTSSGRNGHPSIMKLLDINPIIRSQLMEYGDTGENAFDVYTLYKSTAKRRLTDTIETSDARDMQYLAWMTREELFEARRLLRRLGYITEIVDRGEGRRPEIREVRIEPRSPRNQ